jgi:2-keto-3-deoxy-6-phosphogluconate aldolase
MSFKAAFIFIAPETDPTTHKALVDAPVVQLHVVGVKNYQEAVTVAKQLVAQGVEAIELCAGFGIEGVAQIKQAVQGKAVVGVVRFDNHPGFEHRSGDALFN